MTGRAGTVIRLPGVKELPKGKRALASRMNTLEVTPAGVKAWKSPPFQRPLKVNAKVIAVCENIKTNGGVIPGVIVLGELGRETYLLDGQHRREAFLLSGIDKGYVDVRIVTFQDLGEMGEEYVDLNSHLVVFKPDDILRGLEESMQPVSELRRRCKFIGYDSIRRGTNSPVISMSAALRSWVGSGPEVPGKTESVLTLARNFTEADSVQMIQFMTVVHGAWRSDPEYWKLWGTLNVTLVAWLWRRLVLPRPAASLDRHVKLTAAEFGDCAMALSADAEYLGWLIGRSLSDRDRAPCLRRIKELFTKRLNSKGKPGKLPAPAWATGTR